MTIERPMLPPAAESVHAFPAQPAIELPDGETLTSESAEPASNVVEFPGNPPPDGYSEAYIDKLHSEAFRDLEPSIGDFVSMGQLAAQRMSNTDNGDEMLAFSVFHLNRMLKAFKEEYYARWNGERRG